MTTSASPQPEHWDRFKSMTTEERANALASDVVPLDDLAPERRERVLAKLNRLAQEG